MPRRQIACTAGLVFHVINRGARRMRIFDRPGDYQHFLDLAGEAQRRVPVDFFAYCLMPNHFHLVLRPRVDGDLSAFMRRLCSTHGKRWNLLQGTGGTGAVYQGRFKALPVYTDHHFLCVCRYVERNPLKGNLVPHAEEWSWSSMAQRGGRRQQVVLSDWPVARPAGWASLVNESDSEETEELRRAIARNAPFGPLAWRERIASQLGMKHSLRPIGRPRNPVSGDLF